MLSFSLSNELKKKSMDPTLNSNNNRMVRTQGPDTSFQNRVAETIFPSLGGPCVMTVPSQIILKFFMVLFSCEGCQSRHHIVFTVEPSTVGSSTPWVFSQCSPVYTALAPGGCRQCPPVWTENGCASRSVKLGCSSDKGLKAATPSQ